MKHDPMFLCVALVAAALTVKSDDPEDVQKVADDYLAWLEFDEGEAEQAKPDAPSPS